MFNSEEVQRIVFHFNKKHLEDRSIPCWVVKHKGVTYYAHHLESTVGFSTKETPDNSHTQAAIQFKGKLSLVEEDGIITAYIN